MATGGCEAVYRNTTNPLVATGDGIAMVYRAKGAVKNMEFIQFHPTALFHPGDRPCFLITEAMRGYGGVLRTLDGKEFMQKYDKRLSLAPRDIVARAIDNEMKLRGDDHVYLDVTHKDPEETKKHFPNIYKKCLSIGIDITKDYIPVAPAAHYLCGGISVDLNGQSSIRRLYAIGECSCTGLHGGNRLASNSLIEAVVYADAAAKHILSVLERYDFNTDIPEWNDEGTISTEERVLITQSMKEVNQMDTDLFNFLTTQGSFALLFGYLLLYVLKQNQIREENYQKIIEQLNNALPTIKTDLEDIKKMIM